MQRMDPQLRKLLEVTHEAWVDSGVDVKQLRGSSKVRGSGKCHVSRAPAGYGMPPPAQLQESRTNYVWCAQVGVYLGCCGSEVHALWLGDVNNITGYEQTGCTMSMFANRLSFTYDFKGPSKAVDTGATAMAETWWKAPGICWVQGNI